MHRASRSQPTSNHWYEPQTPKAAQSSSTPRNWFGSPGAQSEYSVASQPRSQPCFDSLGAQPESASGSCRRPNHVQHDVSRVTGTKLQHWYSTWNGEASDLIMSLTARDATHATSAAAHVDGSAAAHASSHASLVPTPARP